MDDVRLILGDCLQVLPTLESGSVDAVITDPPYPCIKREYGYWTEAEWFDMMRVVVPQCMRVLKSTGSAVFILQPNSERVGRMRTWLWDFMAWVGKEYGIVQDAWWWNVESLPVSRNDPNLMRPSLKACVWVGTEGCYRDGGKVLWEESDGNRAMRLSSRCDNVLQTRPSGATIRNARARNCCVYRGGTTPFNVLPMGHDAAKGGHNEGHGAATPLALCRWWTRYICPPGGVVLDPFIGSGTVALAAIREQRKAIGIERDPGYFAIAEKRIKEKEDETPLFNGVPEFVQADLFAEGP